MEIICNAYKICQFCGKRLPDKDTSRFSLFGIEFNACKECTDKIYDKHIQQNYDYDEIATTERMDNAKSNLLKTIQKLKEVTQK